MYLLLLAACSFDHPSEITLIQEHLAGVRHRLETQPERPDRTPLQQVRRNAALANLAAYERTARFPHNHRDSEGRERTADLEGGFAAAPGRTPVFVDEHGTSCAVGHLMEQSGAHTLVRRIRDEHNTAWIQELTEVDGVAEWVEDSGLSVDELARIQPSYCHSKEPIEHGITAGLAALTATTGIWSGVQLARKRSAWLALGLGAGGASALVAHGTRSTQHRCGPIQQVGRIETGAGIGATLASAVGFVVAGHQHTVAIQVDPTPEQPSLSISGTW